MIPAAAADLKYRTVSLESCVAALLAGCVVFGWWALTVSTHEVMVAGIIGGSTSLVTFLCRRMMGSGDWWFIIGIVLAVSTIHPLAMLCMFGMSTGALLFCHVIICVRHPGLPFPQKLYRFKKRAGDRFCVDVASGELLETDVSGMIVKPGLPMITFIVVAAFITGLVFVL